MQRNSLYTRLSAWAPRLLLAVLAAAGLCVMVTAGDYGITWDEPLHAAYGVKVLKFYKSGFHNRSALDYVNLYLYGGFFDALLATIDQWFRWAPLYTTRHLVSGLYGLFGIFGASRLARLLGGPVAALLAALILLTTSVYYGHMFNNPKDLPFATGYIWSLYYMTVFFRSAPTVPRRVWLRLGVATGAALGVRVGGLLLLCYFALATVVWLGADYLRLSRSWTQLRARAPQLLLRVAASSVVAYGLMLLFWPWAQEVPLLRPFEALAVANHFPWIGKVLFEGEHLAPEALPLRYLPKLLLIQLPELYPAALLLAAGLGLWQLRRGLRLAYAVDAVLLLAGAFLPLVYTLVTRPPLYDNFRHLLFILPPLAVLSALALTEGFKRLPGRLAPALAVASLGLYLAFQLSLMVRLHPEEYVSYNTAFGGLPAAQGQYELDYWANGMKAALGKLRQRATADGLIAPGKPPLQVMGLPALPVELYLKGDRDLAFTGDSSKADFVIQVPRLEVTTETAGPLYEQLERFGIPLILVRDLRQRASTRE